MTRFFTQRYLLCHLAAGVLSAALATGAGAIQLPGATCGDPDANGLSATDALFVLNVAIGLQHCDDCICDLDGSGGVTATDSLLALRAAVGSPAELLCPPCAGGSSTTTFPPTTSTTTTTTTGPASTTSTVTTTTLGSGDGFPLPQGEKCDVEFSANGDGLLGFLVFNVFYDPGVGDFERNDSTLDCRAIPTGMGVSAVGLDGDQAPGHVRMSFLISGGLPLPSPVMACSFVADAGGADTSIFSITIKTATNTSYQAIPVDVEISGATCSAN